MSPFAVETQRLSLAKLVKKISTRLLLSPKPPSSKMEVNFETLDFIVSQLDPDKVTFKIPVFDDADLALLKEYKNATNQMSFSYLLEILNPRLQEILSKINWTVSKNSGNASLPTIAGAMSASFLNCIPSSTIINVVFKIRKKNHVTTRRNENLSLLGNKETNYIFDYQPDVLESFDNRHVENDYFIKFNCPEFYLTVSNHCSTRLCDHLYFLHS